METHSLSQTERLIRRNGIWHYRRRVPECLVAALGRREIHRSLGTASLPEAKKRRTLEDLKWDARFEAAGGISDPLPSDVPISTQPPKHDTLRLVQDFVARLDEQEKAQGLQSPPANEAERSAMRENIGTGLSILTNRDDPRADEWVDRCSLQMTAKFGLPAATDTGFAEMVRRALLELQRRKLARLEDNYVADAFDEVFGPARSGALSFGQLAAQFLTLTQEEAKANRTSQKWVDKQKANIALLTEIVGSGTSTRQVDYDACLRVRSVLARLPANRSKLYNGLSIEQAIAVGDTRVEKLPVGQEQPLRPI